MSEFDSRVADNYGSYRNRIDNASSDRAWERWQMNYVHLHFKMDNIMKLFQS